ncbi:Fe-S oxidoreductase [Ruicaihuangia caeni]|uniref:Fe-S oxidoreductase n=1 Tax=Ruicaihuangia caeni TaxID=3042517 RepID=UPI00338FCEC7
MPSEVAPSTRNTGRRLGRAAADTAHGARLAVLGARVGGKLAVRAAEAAANGVVQAGRRIPGVRDLLLNPLVTGLGFAAATVFGVVWGGVLGGGRIRVRNGMLVITGLPAWAFGRGGTTVGAAFLTDRIPPDRVMRHERVHKEQWRHYGMVLPVLYLAAGRDPLRNRFEIEAGLRDGGYF